MSFQKTVNTYPAANVPGQRAGLNPLVHLLPVPVAATGGVVTARGAFYASRPSTVGNAGSAIAATAGVLTGVVISAELATIQAVTAGAFSITVGGTAYTPASMDFSSITGLDDIAAIIDTALTAVSCPAGASMNAANTAVIITTDGTGSTATIAAATAPLSGTDVSAMFGLTASAGAVAVQGTNAITSACLGIIQREMTGAIPSNAEYTMTIDAGHAVPVVVKGDLYVTSAASVAAGNKVFASLTDGTLTGAAAGASVSGSVETQFTIMESASAGTPFLVSAW